MDMANLLGQMEKFMRVNLEMMFDMARAFTGIQVERWENSCGKRDKQIIDYTQNNNKNIEGDVNMRKKKKSLLINKYEMMLNIIITIN